MLCKPALLVHIELMSTVTLFMTRHQTLCGGLLEEAGEKRGMNLALIKLNSINVFAN